MWRVYEDAESWAAATCFSQVWNEAWEAALLEVGPGSRRGHGAEDPLPCWAGVWPKGRRCPFWASGLLQVKREAFRKGSWAPRLLTASAWPSLLWAAEGSRDQETEKSRAAGWAHWTVCGHWVFCLNICSPVAQTIKHLPATWETQVWSLGWEDPLEKEMATHSSTVAWKIPWMEGPGGLQSIGSQRVGHDWVTSLFTSSLIKET